jgi:hypothetical protein
MTPPPMARRRRVRRARAGDAERAAAGAAAQGVPQPGRGRTRQDPRGQADEAVRVPRCPPERKRWGVQGLTCTPWASSYALPCRLHGVF